MHVMQVPPHNWVMSIPLEEDPNRGNAELIIGREASPIVSAP